MELMVARVEETNVSSIRVSRMSSANVIACYFHYSQMKTEVITRVAEFVSNDTLI